MGRVTAKAALMLAAKRWTCCTHRVPCLRVLSTTTTAIRALSSSIFSSRSFPKAPALLSNPFSLNSNFSTRRERGEIEETEEEVDTDDWEEEEEVEPKIGDGGDGGGIVLGEVAWGERALSVAREVLLQFDDIDLYAFKLSPKGYIYVRLDKLINKYGCPSMEEIEKFSSAYKKRLDEIGESGEIPDNLALQVSSPGAERLLRVPDDLDRFKDMPMWVSYSEDSPESKQRQEVEKVLLLDSVDIESQQCVWKLANVRENRDVQSKGRPLSRKQRDWRLTLSFDSIKKVALYLDSK